MHELLKAHITHRLGEEPPHLDQVLACFEPLEVPRQTQLLEAGTVCQAVYFIVEGCLQVYVLDADGQESTREFFFEEDWVTDIFGFQQQLPSQEYIRAVEPCRLLAVRYADFQTLAAAVPAFSAVYQQILETSYRNAIYRVNTFTSMNALARINWLMQHRPRILTRLPGKLVASYLGISPETFTRLRGKV